MFRVWCAELAGCIIAAVQGQEVVINEATGVDDDEDEEEVDISEDSEDEGGAGFHHFERRPRSQRKRINHSAPGALGPSSDGATLILCPWIWTNPPPYTLKLCALYVVGRHLRLSYYVILYWRSIPFTDGVAVESCLALPADTCSL